MRQKELKEFIKFPQEKKVKTPYKMFRPPTMKKGKFSTVPPPAVFLKPHHLELLRYLKKEIFFYSIKGYAFDMNVAKSTFIGYLEQLRAKELVEIPEERGCKRYARTVITDKGLDALKSLNDGVERHREGCRIPTENLSSHKAEFVLKISSISDGSIEKLKKLGYIDYNAAELSKNNTYHHFTYERGSISIYTNVVKIRTYDILTKTMEQFDIEALDLVFKWQRKLEKCGIVTEGCKLEKAHFARVESLLCKFMKKIDDKYFLDLGDGKLFWIDRSNEEEDETNSREVRERADAYLKDAFNNSKSLPSDLDKALDDMDKIKSILSEITRIQLLEVPKMQILTENAAINQNQLKQLAESQSVTNTQLSTIINNIR